MRPQLSLAFCVFATALCAAGCASPQALPQGRGAIVASYAARTLTSTLPDAARVPAALAAADLTLRARGYTVDRLEATEESGQIVARAPTSSEVDQSWAKVVVAAKRRWNGTVLTIEFVPWGNQSASRVLLDGILQRLDL